jgi:hypothetical protein
MSMPSREDESATLATESASLQMTSSTDNEGDKDAESVGGVDNDAGATCDEQPEGGVGSTGDGATVEDDVIAVAARRGHAVRSTDNVKSGSMATGICQHET